MAPATLAVAAKIDTVAAGNEADQPKLVGRKRKAGNLTVDEDSTLDWSVARQAFVAHLRKLTPSTRSW
jgi:hypothetical protein